MLFLQEKLFPHNKHFSSYPAIKIGRLAVSVKYRHEGIGGKLLDIIKHCLYENNYYSDFRFLTVDAYLSEIPFYEKNDFRFLDAEDKNKHTRLMYFDMLEM